MITQNSFYYVPKERLANLFNLPSSFDPKGFLVYTHYEPNLTPVVGARVAYSEYKIILYDYVVPQHAIRTPEMQAYVGQMGTRAEIQAEDSWDVSKAKSLLDEVAKEFEI